MKNSNAGTDMKNSNAGNALFTIDIKLSGQIISIPVYQ